jgi:PAS domain S-box-containing protein
VSLDHLPAILDDLADMADDLAAGEQPRLPLRDIERHAQIRQAEGFDLEEVTDELGVLRGCIRSLWRSETAGVPERDVHLLEESFDDAVTLSIVSYARSHERLLRALDRVSSVALASETVEEFLAQQCHTLVELSPAVDTVSFFLAAGDELRLAAAAGLEAQLVEPSTAPTVRRGEGLIGGVAASRAPAFAAFAADDGSPGLAPALHARGIQALYAVPLLEGERVLGVVQVGSLHAIDFSSQDRTLFEALAARAAAGLRLQQLRAALEERAASLEASERTLRARERDLELLVQRERETSSLLDSLIEAAPVGVAFLDTELRYVRVNAALARINGLPVEEHLGRTTTDVIGPGGPLLDALLKEIMATREPLLGAELSLPPDEARRIRTFLTSYFPVIGADGSVLGVGGVVIEVTELKRADEERQALLDSERAIRAELEAVIEAIPDAIYIGDATGVKRANAAARSLLGFSSRADQGEAAGLASAGLDVRSIDGGEPIPAADRPFARALRGEASTSEHTIRHPQTGAQLYVRSTAAPIRTGDRTVAAVEIAADITVKQLAEQRAQILADVSAMLASSLSVPTTIELLHRVLVPRFADSCHVDVRDDRAEAAGFADGHRIEVALLARGRHLGTLTLTREEPGRFFVDEDLAMAQELGRRAGTAIDNAHLFEAEQQAAEFRERFIGILGHDLRNPLNAILMTTALLSRRPECTEDLVKLVQRAEASALRMRQILDDVLDFAKGRFAGQSIALRPQRFDLMSVVEEAVQELELAHPDRVVLRSATGDTVGVLDRGRLGQVVSNLVGNALKYSPATSVVTLHARGTGPMLTFEVHNVGDPIPPHALPHIFDPFRRAAAYSDASDKSLGLGLYIVEQVVRAHGGWVSVRSSQEEGTTFTVTLPRDPGQKPGSRRARSR